MEKEIFDHPNTPRDNTDQVYAQARLRIKQFKRLIVILEEEERKRAEEEAQKRREEMDASMPDLPPTTPSWNPSSRKRAKTTFGFPPNRGDTPFLWPGAVSDPSFESSTVHDIPNIHPLQSRSSSNLSNPYTVESSAIPSTFLQRNRTHKPKPHRNTISHSHFHKLAEFRKSELQRVEESEDMDIVYEKNVNCNSTSPRPRRNSDCSFSKRRTDSFSRLPSRESFYDSTTDEWWKQLAKDFRDEIADFYNDLVNQYGRITDDMNALLQSKFGLSDEQVFGLADMVVVHGVSSEDLLGEDLPDTLPQLTVSYKSRSASEVSKTKLKTFIDGMVARRLVYSNTKMCFVSVNVRC